MAHIKERRTRRGIAYHVCWREGNYHRSHTTHTLEEALLARLAVERGETPEHLIPDTTTLAAFLDEWEPRWKLGKRPKTIRAGTDARARLGDLEQVRLARLTAAMVEDRVAELAGTAPRQAQMTLQHLQKALRSAQARGHLIDQRILQLSKPSYEGRQTRFLTWAEVERLAAFVDPSVNRIVPFAALTGMRRTELFDLTDKQVDLTEGSVTLRVTKTGKPRKVWLAAHAQQLLREQLVAREPNPAGLVFPTRSGHRLASRFEKSYREAVKAAGLPGATFHSLRHTCASLMIAAGCNPLEIAEQLGHLRGGKPDPSMIWQRYGWLYENATRQAVKRLDGLLADAAEEATA